MSFNKYFQDELSYLRELGKEFSDANPQLAPFLAERGSDPDVERLLEGFSFLTARLSQKLNDEMPELTHGMIEMMWPHYLRPVPSMSVVEFTPVANAVTEKRTIKQGVEVDSVPVEGTPCRFRTCYDVDVMPISLKSADVKHDAQHSYLNLTFSLHSGASLGQLKPQKIRLFLNGDPVITQTLYLWLCRYLDSVVVKASGNEQLEKGVKLAAQSVKPVGFGLNESLFDYSENVFPGYRLLQDYFVLQDKFLFIDIENLGVLAHAGNATEFSIQFTFERFLDEHIRVNKNHFRLHATPVANVFKRDADPLRVNHQSMEYRIRPNGRNSTHFDIFSIDKVESKAQGITDRRIYTPINSFEHEEGHRENVGHYHKRIKPATGERRFETYISFAGQKNTRDKLTKEIISLELTCTNRYLPEKLKVGDIKIPTASSPEFVTFSNITSPSSTVYPPLDEGLQWQLISNMSLNYSSLTNPQMLRTIIAAYDFKALTDRQAERQLKLKLAGIGDIQVTTGDRLIKGHPIRGISINMTMKESHFTSEGDMYLFASVLDRFFSLYASINSYHQLTVVGEEKGELYTWPLKMGLQNIL
ncbi:type VI secretion system baseplate subunit TssF [Alteromonadaceae bacterium BrNp21-10]|nr:type VI secretion system baseplate subunit TssF [Alteromonadaceae bacterium BrNp21-10]